MGVSSAPSVIWLSGGSGYRCDISYTFGGGTKGRWGGDEAESLKGQTNNAFDLYKKGRTIGKKHRRDISRQVRTYDRYHTPTPCKKGRRHSSLSHFTLAISYYNLSRLQLR
jgi:hypothetical protein